MLWAKHLSFLLFLVTDSEVPFADLKLTLENKLVLVGAVLRLAFEDEVAPAFLSSCLAVGLPPFFVPFLCVLQEVCYESNYWYYVIQLFVKQIVVLGDKL